MAVAFGWVRLGTVQAESAPVVPPMPSISLVSEQPDRIQLSEEFVARKRVQTAAVIAAPAAAPLQLPGSLNIDPNYLARVNCLFSGRVRSIGMHGNRPLRNGDRVKKGDVLAVIWSKDVGEKKSELVDAISHLKTDEKLLARYQSVDPGVVAQRNVDDARRNVEADLVAVARAERTLRSWRLAFSQKDEDRMIAAIKKEADNIHARKGRDPEVDRTWAEAIVYAPLDGTIVEMNVIGGNIVPPPSGDLFMIAQLDHLQVVANAYEEDLPALRNLSDRKWKIGLRGEPDARPLDGKFETIGNIIDPTQHTGVVMGPVDNAAGHLRVGQFITATVALPPDPTLVAVRASAIIEEGKGASVYVEADARSHQFVQRKVAVTHRGNEWIFVRSIPNAEEKKAGAEGLKAGEKVITSGVLELAAEHALQKSAHANPSE
jgi:cobalt-zinc-cadmium efflux system membrane fusion protein